LDAFIKILRLRDWHSLQKANDHTMPGSNPFRALSGQTATKTDRAMSRRDLLKNTD
jgi:hypothetical protein